MCRLAIVYVCSLVQVQKNMDSYNRLAMQLKGYL